MKNRFLTICLLFIVASSAASAQWTRVTTNLTGYLNDFTFTSPTTGYVIGDGEEGLLISKTTEGGTTWRPVHSVQGNAVLEAIRFGDPSTGIVVGYLYEESILLRTTDAGESWQPVTTGVPDSAELRSVSFADQNTIYIAGVRTIDEGAAFVMKSSDKGATWEVLPDMQFFATGILELAFADAMHGFAAGMKQVAPGDPGALLANTTDGGQTWGIEGRSPDRPTWAVDAVDTSVAYMASTEMIYRTVTGGMTWEEVPLGHSGILITDIDFIDSSVGFAVGGTMKGEARVFMTTDAGESWHEQSIAGEGVKMVRRVMIVDGSLAFAIGNSGGASGSLLKYAVHAGVDEGSDQAAALSIAPNPARESFTVTIADGVRDAELRLHSMNGQLVHRQSIASGSREVTIDTRDLAAGVYVVELRSGPTVSRRTVVIGK
jgi:photosystem II stability/assembly factor-like uncharacterized protein